MSKLYFRYLTVFTFIFPLICFGQNYLSIKYGVNNGLLSNDNYRTYQDLDGYIWILSEKGITKFNGKKFKYFTTAQGLNTNDVWDIGIDSQNRKWLKTFSDGIQYIKNDSVVTISGTEKYGRLVHVGEHRDTVFFIQYDKNRNIKKRFFVTKNDTFGEYVKQKRGHQLIFDYSPYNVQYYKTDGKTLGYFIGEEFKNDDEISNFFSHDGSPPNENQPVLSVLFRNKEIKWEYFKNGRLVDFSLSDITKSKITKLFYDVNYNRVIVQTTDQFFVFKNIQTFDRDYELEFRLNDNAELNTLMISHITIDAEQNIWVVKNRGEVFFFPNGEFSYRKLFCKTDYHIGNTIVLYHENADMFFMDRPNKLYKIGKGDCIHKVDLTINDPSIRQFEYHDNRLFFISDYHFVEHNEKTSVSKLLYKTKDRLYSFTFINENQLLFSNGDVFDLTANRIISHINIPYKATDVLYFNSNVIYYYNDRIYVVDFKQNNLIKEIYLKNIQSVKRINNQLFAIAGKDLYTVDVKSLKTKKIHTSSHDIRHVSFQNGHLNLITDKYLIFAEFDFTTNSIYNLDYIDLKPYGFQVNGIKWKDHSSAYIYTTDGVFLIQKFHKDKIKPSVPFKLNYNNQLLKNPILLSSKNSILIDVESISYANFGEVVYRYRIDNQPYIYTTEEKILIENLTPGKHVFQIESAPNSFSKYGNKQLLKIIVEPTLYEKPVFKIITILFVLVCITCAVLLTKRLMSIRNRRTLRIKELELSALRAQLNPHFVFNVLNSIQGVMLYQSREQANEYIYSFSELIRIVLNNSKQKKVALSEELKLIRSYLELENMRLNETLHYSITNLSNIDPESIPVYGMVIQPFVENCIVHGFKTNQDKKEINITFDVQKGHLNITIEDNGIGRKKANQMKKNTNHKSWASTILQEKSELLNSISERELIINTFDILHENGDTGTKVVIVMRIN